MLTLYDALVSINVPGDQARAVVEALEHEMYTALATKADLAHQAQLYSERLERLRLEIRADRLEDLATLRGEMRAMGDGIRGEMQAGEGSLREQMRAGDAALRDEMRAMRDELRGEMQTGFSQLEAADGSIRAEMRAMGDEIRAEMRAMGDEIRAEMRAGDASLRGEMQAGFRRLEAADAAIRLEIAQLANTLTLRMGVGFAAVAGLVISAQQFL